MKLKSKKRSRYSIGEWHGISLEKLSSKERLKRAEIEWKKDALTGSSCPFQFNAICNKKGGVCSLRLYEQTVAGSVQGVGSIITNCPQRFLEGNIIFKWIGEQLLDTSDPIILGQIGFLDPLNPSEDSDSEFGENNKFIGRIDNVLVHPTKTPMDWCAVEIQAVYFSGSSMRNEFHRLAKTTDESLPFPARIRRPDWRSSGPKRLLPQLQTKVPTIRTWGKKMAVVIDEAFYGSLSKLEEEKHLSNAEIIWFVVGYEPSRNGWRLEKRKAVYSKLDSSVKSLTGGVPLSKERFEQQLRRKLSNQNPASPLAL